MAYQPIRTKPEPPCPECGHKKMKLRRPKPTQDWKAFWGCSRFPECKGSRAILKNGDPAGLDETWYLDTSFLT